MSGQETPFLEAARNGDEYYEILLRIALAHRIVNKKQFKSKFEEGKLEALVAKHLKPDDLAAAVSAFRRGDASVADYLQASTSRMSKYLPKSKR